MLEFCPYYCVYIQPQAVVEVFRLVEYREEWLSGVGVRQQNSAPVNIRISLSDMQEYQNDEMYDSFTLLMADSSDTIFYSNLNKS